MGVLMFRPGLGGYRLVSDGLRRAVRCGGRCHSVTPSAKTTCKAQTPKKTPRRLVDVLAGRSEPTPERQRSAVFICIFPPTTPTGLWTLRAIRLTDQFVVSQSTADHARSESDFCYITYSADLSRPLERGGTTIDGQADEIPTSQGKAERRRHRYRLETTVTGRLVQAGSSRPRIRQRQLERRAS